MKKSPSPKRKLAVSLVLLVLALAVAIGATAAIYTSQVFQRSVVRNRDTEAIRFSSDKLYRVMGDPPMQTYYYPMNENQTTMRFTVCNYDQEKNTVVNENDISYTITFSIPEETNTFSYSVNNTSAKDGTLTLSGKLKGKQSSLDRYLIDFGTNPYTDTKINVKVTPDDASLAFTKNYVLQATLVPIGYATTQGVVLTTNYPDNTRGTPDQFDAYNLSVVISGGERDVVIGWDEKQLNIDPFFVQKIVNPRKGTMQKDGVTYTTLTFSMNPENETSAYLIQFYNNSATTTEWKEWKALPIIAELLPE